MTKKIKTINKSLIFLKSSVVAMGIIFVVLFVALIFVRQKKVNKISANCQKFLQLQILGEVQKMELQGNNIIILTSPNRATKKQEIIKIDSNCVAIINKIELNQ